MMLKLLWSLTLLTLCLIVAIIHPTWWVGIIGSGVVYHCFRLIMDMGDKTLKKEKI